jgi:ring-1,2-phenylacetyl-CoA epoxidase subunit PaaE
MDLFELPVSAIKVNTKNALTIDFDVPETLKNTFQFTAGQHLALDFKLERNNYRRTYSICSSPTENKLTISVKRQKNGIVSNFINNAFYKGLTVKVSAPFGGFFDKKQVENTQNVQLWAGGSGITPLFSILKYLIATDKKSVIHLIYANKNAKSVMFQNDLADLERAFPQRLKVTHVLSELESDKKNIFERLFSTSKTQPKSGNYITADFIKNNVLPKAVHYICGPEPMMKICENGLFELGIDKKNVHLAYFSNGMNAFKNAENAHLQVSINGKKQGVPLNNKNLLDAMLDAKLTPPYACQSGTCGSCKAQLISGEVTMARDFALNEADRAANRILCCQAWAKTENVEIQF